LATTARGVVFGRKLFKLFGNVYDQRNSHSRVARKPLVPRHSATVIAEENDDRVLLQPSLLQIIQVFLNPLVHNGDVVVMLSPVGSHLRKIN